MDAFISSGGNAQYRFASTIVRRVQFQQIWALGNPDRTIYVTNQQWGISRLYHMTGIIRVVPTKHYCLALEIASRVYTCVVYRSTVHPIVVWLAVFE